MGHSFIYNISSFQKTNILYLWDFAKAECAQIQSLTWENISLHSKEADYNYGSFDK